MDSSGIPDAQHDEGEYSPHAWRQAYIEEMISRRAAKAEVMEILNVACGPGALLAVLAKQGFAVHGIDRSPTRVGQARAMLSRWMSNTAARVGLGSVEALDFESDRFDAIVAPGVLADQPDDGRSLGELARVLRPGGYLIADVRNRFGYVHGCDALHGVLEHTGWPRRIRSFIHERRFQRSKLRQIRRPRLHVPRRFDAMLAQHGFRVEERQYFHFSLLPAPLDAVAPRFCKRIGAWCEQYGRSSVAPYFGGGYLVAARYDPT